MDNQASRRPVPAVPAKGHAPVPAVPAKGHAPAPPDEKPDRFRDPSVAPSLTVPAGRWRYPLDEREHAELSAALAKHVGREAKLPVWHRRLAIASDGRPLLIVQSCRPVNPGRDDHCAPWRDPDNTRVIEMVLPMADAFELLASPHNPELELRRRLDLCKRHADEEEAKAKAAAERAAAERAALAKLERERRDFRALDWARVQPFERALLLLALAVEPRDKALASDLRTVANASVRGETVDFPRAVWWEGVTFPPMSAADKHRAGMLDAVAARHVVATIPPEKRVLLEIMHGPDDVRAIAAGWLDSLQMDTCFRPPRAG